MELLSDFQGEDVDRLRAEISWRARNWTQAGYWSERLIGDHWRDDKAISDEFALYAMRAAIAYALSEDKLSLDRLRGRFGSKFTDRPDAPVFRFLTSPAAKRAPLASEYAASFPGGSAVDGFMSYYQTRYLTPKPAKNSDLVTPQKSG